MPLANVSAQTADTTQEAAAQRTAISSAAPASDAPIGDAQEVQQLLGGNALETLRSTSNGSSSSRLVVDTRAGNYYAVLLQQGNVWRVVKTSDEGRAVAAYRTFAKLTERLSSAEVRSARLEVDKSKTEQRLAVMEQRANQLEADLNTAHEQAAIVDSREREARTHVAELKAQRDATATKLVQTQNQVAALQRQVYAGVPDEHAAHRARHKGGHRLQCRHSENHDGNHCG